MEMVHVEKKSQETWQQAMKCLPQNTSIFANLYSGLNVQMYSPFRVIQNCSQTYQEKRRGPGELAHLFIVNEADNILRSFKFSNGNVRKYSVMKAILMLILRIRGTWSMSELSSVEESKRKMSLWTQSLLTCIPEQNTGSKKTSTMKWLEAGS